MNKSQLSKSISELEGEEWRHPGPDTPQMALRCYELRKKALNDLQPADLRVLIGQDIGLTYVVPIAINLVEADPLLETEYYRGDLLASLLRASPAYFRRNPYDRKRLEKVIDSLQLAVGNLDDVDIEVTSEALEEAVTLFRKFVHLT